MDFGDILDKWEKGNVPPAGEWLRLYPVRDKDAALPERAGAPGERRRRLLRKKPDGEIDLHGLLQDEAWAALETFFQDSRRRGFEKVLIIHGKGNHSAGEGALKRLSVRFIEQCPFAGESGHNSAPEGGSGATWVILKDERRGGLQD